MPPYKRTILVVQPDPADPLDLFDRHFSSAGLSTRVIRPFDGDQVPGRVDAAGLLVLGGDMGAHDDDKYPWLADVRALLSSAVQQEIPTLGICLGGQLLAASRGGIVEQGAAGMEVGAVRVNARAELKRDALLSRVSWPATYATMHRDAVAVLPPEATWLAESDLYPHQAFRVGSMSWGVQFHPEVSLPRFRDWAGYVKSDPETKLRIERGTAEFAAMTNAVSVAAEQLANSFAHIVLTRDGVAELGVEA